VNEDQLMHKQGGYKPTDVPAAFGPHGPVVLRAVARMAQHDSDSADPDTASVLRKALGEVLLLGGHTQEALVQLRVRATSARQACPSAVPYPRVCSQRPAPAPAFPCASPGQAAADLFRSFTHCDCTSLVKSCEDFIAVALERLRP
jgi:hypothetical protein